MTLLIPNQSVQLVNRDVLVLGFRGQTRAVCVDTCSSYVGRRACLRLNMG